MAPSSEAMKFVFFGLFVVASLAVAHVFHVLIERPSADLARRLKPRARPA